MQDINDLNDTTKRVLQEAGRMGALSIDLIGQELGHNPRLYAEQLDQWSTWEHFLSTRWDTLSLAKQRYLRPLWHMLQTWERWQRDEAPRSVVISAAREVMHNHLDLRTHGPQRPEDWPSDREWLHRQERHTDDG